MKATSLLVLVLVLCAVVAATAGATARVARCDGCEGFLIRAFPDGRGEQSLAAHGDDYVFQDVAPDLGHVLFIGSDHALYRETPNGRDVHRVAASVQYALYAPDGRHISYFRLGDSSCQNALWVAAADGSGARRVGCNVSQETWSPDSARLAYVDLGVRAIVVVGIDGRGRRVVSRVPGVGAPVWSPEGDRIAYTVEGRRTLLHVVRVDGSHDIAIALGGRALWAPNGRDLAFFYGRVQSGLAVIRADGTHFRLVKAPGASAPAWAPDGRLTYETNRDIRGEAADGTAQRSIVHIGAGSSLGNYWWAPNGLLAYGTTDAQFGEPSIWVARGDGSHRRRVAHEPGPGGDETGVTVDQLWWAPNSRSIVFRAVIQRGG